MCLETSEKIKIASECPAMKMLYAQYPERYNKRVPLKVRMLQSVQSDMPFGLCGPGMQVLQGVEYYVWVNSYGAVSAILDDGKYLGLKSNEFEVTEWHQK